MRPEAGHSMMASWSSTPGRATRTMRRALPDQRMAWPQCTRRIRMPRNRTSRTESRATALYPSRPMCNGRRHWPSRSRREQKRRARTRDEADKEALGAPSCGRSQTLLYQELRRHLGEVFRRLALQKESKVEEGHLMPDHVHMLLSIPPKYAVSQVVGFIKGKSAIHMARVYGERKRNFVGQHFLGPGILRQHGRSRRRGHPRLHPQSREGRSEAGADEPLALTSRLSAAPNSRGRVSDTFCRFERLQS